MRVPFVKYSGCGNDFILIDNRMLGLSLALTDLRQLCHRQQGIGADGVLFLERPKTKEASHRMRIFNADGSEAEMCGNGLRCLAHYIRLQEGIHSPFLIDTMHQVMEVSFLQDLVTIAMPPLNDMILVNLTIQSTPLSLYCLDTGVPHAVILTEVKEADQLLSLAPMIRFHSYFSKGTNVNIASPLADGTLAVRTYERGVEKETLACGTGAVAAAIVSAHVYHVTSPVKVQTRSGDFLYVDFQQNGQQFTHLKLTGPAIKVFEGIVEIGSVEARSLKS